MNATARLLLFCFLSALSGLMQGTLAADWRARFEMPQSSEVPGLSKQEAKDLRERIAASNATRLGLNNNASAPMDIKEAVIKYAKREPAVGAVVSDPAQTYDTYAVSLRVKVTNSGSAEVKGLVLRLGNDATMFTLYRPEVKVSAGKSDVIGVDFMLVQGEPSSLVSSVTGARFSNGTIWGDFPTNPPIQAQPRPAGPAIDPSAIPQPPRVLVDPRPSAPQPPRVPVDPGATAPPPSSGVGSQEPGSQPGNSREAVPSVDIKPVLLNRLRPAYTELARKNGVTGQVLLRILIGSDGEVKKVRVIRALPDFLTEEAIRCAYQLRFKPAMKSGQPVELWQAIEVEFNLR